MEDAIEPRQPGSCPHIISLRSPKVSAGKKRRQERVRGENCIKERPFSPLERCYVPRQPYSYRSEMSQLDEVPVSEGYIQLQEGACKWEAGKLQEDKIATKEYLQELPRYSQEVIELASTLGHHSLGYLLKRDRNFDVALAEMPWLTRQESGGVVVVKSDSFILEELSSSDMDPLEEEGTRTMESQCVCTTYNVSASCSVPVLVKPLVKTLSFRSSGYHSLDSILVDSVPLLEQSPLSNQSETSCLHWFGDSDMESCWSEGSCKEFSKEVDAGSTLSTQEAITDDETLVEFQVKDEESETVIVEDLSQYQPMHPVGFSKEEVQLAQQLGHHSLGYLLQRDKNLEEALNEIPWLTQIGVTVIRSDSFILEELSSSNSMGCLESKENKVAESNADPVSEKDGSIDSNQVCDLSCYITDHSMECKDSDQLFDDFSSLTTVFPPSTTQSDDSGRPTTDDNDSVHGTVSTIIEVTPVSEKDKRSAFDLKCESVIFSTSAEQEWLYYSVEPMILSEYSSSSPATWENKDHFTAPESISPENEFFSISEGYQNPSVMPTIVLTPPANDFPDSTTAQKADVVSPPANLERREVSSFTVTQHLPPTARVDSVSTLNSIASETVASFQGTESPSVTCTLDGCSHSLEASEEAFLHMSMWGNCGTGGHPQQPSIYSGGMARNLQQPSVHTEASCGTRGHPQQPGIYTGDSCGMVRHLSVHTEIEASCGKGGPNQQPGVHIQALDEETRWEREAVPMVIVTPAIGRGGEDEECPPLNSTALIAALTAKTSSKSGLPINKCPAHVSTVSQNHSKEMPSSAPVRVLSSQFGLSRTIAMSAAPTQTSFWESSSIENLNYSVVSSTSDSLLEESVSSTNLMENYSDHNSAVTASTVTKWPTILLFPPHSLQFFEEENFSYTPSDLLQDPEEECGFQVERSLLRDESQFSKEQSLSFVLDEGDNFSTLARTSSPPQKITDSPQFFEENSFEFRIEQNEETRFNDSLLPTSPSASELHIEARTCSSFSSAVPERAPEPVLQTELSVHDVHIPSQYLCLLEELPFSFSVSSFQTQEKRDNPHVGNDNNFDIAFSNSSPSMVISTVSAVVVEKTSNTIPPVMKTKFASHSTVIKSSRYDPVPVCNSYSSLSHDARTTQLRVYFIILSQSAPMLGEEIVSNNAPVPSPISQIENSPSSFSSILDHEPHSSSIVRPTSSKYFEVAGLCEVSTPVNPTTQVPSLDEKERAQTVKMKHKFRHRVKKALLKVVTCCMKPQDARQDARVVQH